MTDEDYRPPRANRRDETYIFPFSSVKDFPGTGWNKVRECFAPRGKVLPRRHGRRENLFNEKG